jgi:hypothetical protein
MATADLIIWAVQIALGRRWLLEGLGHARCEEVVKQVATIRLHTLAARHSAVSSAEVAHRCPLGFDESHWLQLVADLLDYLLPLAYTSFVGYRRLQDSCNDPNDQAILLLRLHIVSKQCHIARSFEVSLDFRQGRVAPTTSRAIQRKIHALRHAARARSG